MFREEKASEDRLLVHCIKPCKVAKQPLPKCLLFQAPGSSKRVLSVSL